jgi:hypothetical protein
MNDFHVRDVISRLKAAFPDPPVSAETEALYARMLADLEYAEVDPIVDELIATTMKLPSISRIRRAVIEPTLDFPTAEEAWVAVQGREKDLHELVRRAAQLLGGTFNIRTSDNPELTRVRFSKVYEAILRKAVDQELAAGIRAKRMQLPRAS